MSYKLTDNEVTDFAMAANNYVKFELPYNQILPIKKIGDCYVHKWYVSTEVEGPESSKDGRAGYDVRTARTEGEANVLSYVYTFEIPRVEATMAQNAGVPLWSENLGNAYRKMNDELCHLQLRGTHPWDKVAVTGMSGGGTACSTDNVLVLWDTPPAPVTHLATGFADVHTAGYQGPFTWLLSSNLKPGLIAKYGAGDPSMTTMTGAYDVGETLWAAGSGLAATAVTRMLIYPMGAPALHDGSWYLYKKDPNYAYLAEVMPVTTTITPELDVRRQCYHGRIEWRGTVAIVQATSICWEDSANLA